LGIIVDQSVKGTIYTYLGVILGFVTTILLARIFSTSQVGLTKILIAYSALFAQLGTLGINGVTIRLFPFFRDEENRHHGFLSLAMLTGIAGFLISTALLLLLRPWLIEISSGKSPLFVEYINWLIIIILFQIFFTIFDGYYTALYNSVHGTFLKEVFQRVLIIVAIGLYFFDILNFHQFVILYIAAMSLPTLFILFTLIHEKHFSLQTDFNFLKKQLLKSILLMAGFSIFNGFSMVVIQYVDVMMINSLVGLGEAGIYSICFFFGLFVSLPARAIYKISNIVAAQAWKNEDIKTIRDIYYKSCLTLFIIGMLLFLGIWANISNIFQIIDRPDYVSGKWVIFFIGLGSLIDLTTGANSSILGTSKFYKVQTLFLVGLVILTVTTNFLLIPRYGITGAALGNAISLTALNIARYLFLFYKSGLQPFNFRFAFVAFIALLSYFFSTLLPPLSNFMIDILVRSAIVIILYCPPIYFFNISDDINDKANEYLRMLKLKK
jgi:O-antigen/teichoic acid export membrane protein